MLASSWATWLERDVLARRFHASPRARCAITTTALVGDAIAAALNAPLFDAGSDDCARVWPEGDKEIHQRQALLDFWSAGTIVASAHLDDIVAALFALAQVDPSAPVRWSPPRGATSPSPSAPAALRLPRLDEQTDTVRGEVCVTGSPGSWAIVAR